MTIVHLIAVAAGLLLFVQVLLLTRSRRLRDRHAFLWLLLSLLALGVAAALPALDWLAEKLGIGYMPTLIFLAGFYLILTMLMYHTAVLSRQQDGLRTLTQEIAYLRKDLQEALQLRAATIPAQTPREGGPAEGLGAPDATPREPDTGGNSGPAGPLRARATDPR
jgi:hypothetical protein